MKQLTLSVLALIVTAGVSFGQLREVDEGGTPNEEQVPDSRLEQHKAFLDGEYRMPAKPRNQWALGIEGGYSGINGDVSPEFGWNAGLNVRKALGYSTSLRLGVNYLNPEGMDEGEDLSYVNDFKFNRTGQTYGDSYYHSFESKVYLPYLDFVLNLNNINFHREQTTWNWDIFAGPAAYIYETESTVGSWTGNLNHVSPDDDGVVAIGDKVTKGTISFGTGFGLRFSDNVSLNGKVRYIPTGTDEADGEYYQDTGESAEHATITPDKDANILANIGLTFALGNDDKSVQPLWWENPLNFTYPYLSDQYEFDDDYLFEDADGDGVVDRLDKEPNSPCSFVDGGGVAIDSDKDGIVDCNDACPFTPAAQIAEIDENGCTESMDKNCCDEVDELRREFNKLKDNGMTGCANVQYPSITFSKNSKTVPASQNKKIQQIAQELSSNPSCRIVVEGFATGRRKMAEQVAWARAKAVADELVDTFGISRDRIIVRYSGVSKYGDSVMVRGARDGESGSSNPAAPFPGN